MYQANFKIKGITPYSASKNYKVPQSSPQEGHEDYEKRTWRERSNYLEDGTIFIPRMAFKYCLATIASYLGHKVPGKRGTFKKHFNAGIDILDDVILNFKKDTVAGEWRFVPSDGMHLGTKRVWKCFPVCQPWESELKIAVIDETITRDVLEDHLKEAGIFVGVGRFRPERGGFYGRFMWSDVEYGDVKFY